MDQKRIETILAKISSVNIAVYGDFCLDSYWMMDNRSSEISIETGLKAEAVANHYNSPGGAANVVANLSALKPAKIRVIGAIGNDMHGRELTLQLQASDADTTSLFIQKEKFDTYCYLKRYVHGKEEPRIDFGCFNERSFETDLKIVEAIEVALQECDALIFNQQILGSINNESFIQKVNTLFGKYSHKIVMLDSRHFNHCFEHTYLKANDRETASLLGIHTDSATILSVQTVKQYGAKIYHKRQKPVFVTCGSRGIIAFDEAGHYEVPGLSLKGELDPVGAGDTAISALTLCLAAGIPTGDAAQFANLAAAVTVRKLFTTGTATGAEMIKIYYESDLNTFSEPAQRG